MSEGGSVANHIYEFKALILCSSRSSVCVVVQSYHICGEDVDFFVELNVSGWRFELLTC